MMSGATLWGAIIILMAILALMWIGYLIKLVVHEDEVHEKFRNVMRAREEINREQEDQLHKRDKKAIIPTSGDISQHIKKRAINRKLKDVDVDESE